MTFPRFLFLASTLMTALAIVIGLAGAPARADEAPRFLIAIEDIPLMPGLVEDEGSETVFDSPEGRIVDAFATGPVSEQAVLHFYGETLPQLGWRQTDVGVFLREDESLIVDFPGGAGAAPPLTVRFHLAPSRN